MVGTLKLDSSLWRTLAANARQNILIALSGAAAAAVTSVVWSGLRALKRRMFIEVDIAYSCEAYRWLELWLSQREEVRATTRYVLRLPGELGPRIGRSQGNAHSSVARDAAAATAGVNEAQPREQWQAALIPRAGEETMIEFEGRHLTVSEIARADPVAEGRKTGHGHDESRSSVLRIRALNRLAGREKQLVLQLVAQARALYQERMKTHTLIWGLHVGGSNMRWRQYDARPSRPLNTVVLEEGMAENILADTRHFIANERWYYARGVPYRRGYLLHGPPGCGKTSFITALAGELHVVICTLNLASKQLSDDKLLELMSEAPRHAILLLEDVDAVFVASANAEPESPTDQPAELRCTPRRETRERSMNSGRREAQAVTGVSFSGLLNALDGVAAQEGKMLFMTTNFLEKLDEALIRPGRIDVRVRIGLASRECARRLFMRFYGGLGLSEDALADAADKFAREIPERRYSMAVLQGHLMKHTTSPNRAVETIDELHAQAALSTRSKSESRLNAT